MMLELLKKLSTTSLVSLGMGILSLFILLLGSAVNAQDQPQLLQTLWHLTRDKWPWVVALVTVSTVTSWSHVVLLHHRNLGILPHTTQQAILLTVALSLVLIIGIPLGWLALGSVVIQVLTVVVTNTVSSFFTKPKELDTIERATSDDPGMLDVGAASAQSIWSGYLEIILSNGAMDARKIRHQTQPCDCGTLGHPSPEFKNVYGANSIVLPVLFELAPLDGDVPEGVATEAELAIHFPECESLKVHPELHVEPVTNDRAGVKGRSYGQHTVYSLLRSDSDDDARVFFPMEWATPISTVKSMNLEDSMLRVQLKAFCARFDQLVSQSQNHSHEIKLVKGLSRGDVGRAIIDAVREEQNRLQAV
eukprot:m.40545 g.40545  ORF g.40545 m.40545 type:complete len:363 (+) comp14123_c0_seq3:1261-2349(+)